MIMEIKLKDSGNPHFHGVYLDRQWEAFNFQFYKPIKDEAECVINTFIPYLKHHYPQIEVELFFTEEFVLF